MTPFSMPIRQVCCWQINKPMDYAGTRWETAGFLAVWNPRESAVYNPSIPGWLEEAIQNIAQRDGYPVSVGDIQTLQIEEGTVFFVPFPSSFLPQVTKDVHDEFTRLMRQPVEVVELAHDLPHEREHLED